MTIDFENESGMDFSPEFNPETLSADIFHAFLDYVQCPYEAEASLTLVTEAEIQKINLKMRGIDKATDVLSFPMNDFPNAGEFSFLEEAPDAFHPETGELLLGDIIISAQHIKDQAKAYGHSHKREFAFLMTHSLLHLIGYDHVEETERSHMEKLQREFLTFIGIER